MHQREMFSIGGYLTQFVPCSSMPEALKRRFVPDADQPGRFRLLAAVTFVDSCAKAL